MLDLKTRCNRGKIDQAATPLTAKLRPKAQKLCAAGMTNNSTITTRLACNSKIEHKPNT